MDKYIGKEFGEIVFKDVLLDIDKAFNSLTSELCDFKYDEKAIEYLNRKAEKSIEAISDYIRARAKASNEAFNNKSKTL